MIELVVLCILVVVFLSLVSVTILDLADRIHAFINERKNK